MIKKAVFEDDLILGMQQKLAQSELQEGISVLPKAVDYINSAIDILEDNGMKVNADRLLSVLLKIAQKHHKHSQKPRDPRGSHDHHSPKSSDEMIKNLLDHGTVFNSADDGAIDVFDADFPEDLEVKEENISNSATFEDE